MMTPWRLRINTNGFRLGIDDGIGIYSMIGGVVEAGSPDGAAEWLGDVTLTRDMRLTAGGWLVPIDVSTDASTAWLRVRRADDAP